MEPINSNVVFTVTAPVNIAVIKYWGKRDYQKNLPLNSSISITINQDQLCTTTTCEISKEFLEDEVILNNSIQSLYNIRIARVFKEIRELAVPELRNLKVHVRSSNNFPTAAGLASSASGFSALVVCLASAYRVEEELSGIARLGSGSACRSLLGGFVCWEAGVDSTGKDSISRQIAPASHWPDLRVLLVVTNDLAKHVASSVAMERCARTSQLLEYRARHCVPERCVHMETAILERDFPTFARLTMQDSNQMHACCLDTESPVVYMTDVSRSVVHLVEALNVAWGSIRCAYTFDAGPNACLFLLQSDVGIVLTALRHFCAPNAVPPDFIRGIPYTSISDHDMKFVSTLPVMLHPNSVKYIISTMPGPGPHVVSNSRVE